MLDVFSNICFPNADNPDAVSDGAADDDSSSISGATILPNSVKIIKNMHEEK